MNDVRIDYRAVRAAYAKLITAIGGRMANSPFDNGGYRLDRQGGGWRIEKINLKGTGVTTPFGGKRLTSAQLISHIEFTLLATQAIRNNMIENEDTRCDFCRENNIENCRHEGM